MTKDEALKPWWWPKITDTVWCQSVREECEEARDMTDEDIRDEYADGQKYDTLWDHLGDAYEDYERVADALTAKEAECERLRGIALDALDVLRQHGLPEYANALARDMET